MEKTANYQGLSDAAALLQMVETLAEGVSNGKLHQSSVPWAGIKLAVAQSRAIILNVAENRANVMTHGTLAPGENYRAEIRREAQSVDSSVQKSSTVPKATYAASGLASRVQRVPADAGRVRELVGNGKIASSQAVGSQVDLEISRSTEGGQGVKG